MADNAIRNLSAPEIKVHWRDVIEVDIKDPVLKAKVTGFLDKLEKSAFKYDLQDPNTKKITTHELSGQNILQRIADVDGAYKGTAIGKILEDQHILHNGKIVIAQHDRPYAHNDANGSQTIWMGTADPKKLFLNLNPQN